MPIYSFAVICSSNVNRSVETHDLFMKNGMKVSSYGTGSKVKLPGKRQDTPKIYPFGTTYAAILADLIKTDEDLFTRRGIIPMIRRDMTVKSAPQRFQQLKTVNEIDVIICFDHTVYDKLVEDLQMRPMETMKCLHVFNMNVQDNPTEAANGAKSALLLANILQKYDNIGTNIHLILDEFSRQTNIDLLYSQHFL
ncbi:hypothetical protein WA158_007159 [Blastocystis sp. Blastoise]